MTTLGEVLKLFRLSGKNEEDTSTSKLAEKLEVSSTFISEVENGRKTPSLENFKKFAKAFGVPTYEIFRIQEDANENNWDRRRILLEVVQTCVKYQEEEKK